VHAAARQRATDWVRSCRRDTVQQRWPDSGRADVTARVAAEADAGATGASLAVQLKRAPLRHRSTRIRSLADNYD